MYRCKAKIEPNYIYFELIGHFDSKDKCHFISLLLNFIKSKLAFYDKEYGCKSNFLIKYGKAQIIFKSCKCNLKICPSFEELQFLIEFLHYHSSKLSIRFVSFNKKNS